MNEDWIQHNEYAYAFYTSADHCTIRITLIHPKRWKVLHNEEHRSLWDLLRTIRTQEPQHQHISFSSNTYAYAELSSSPPHDHTIPSFHVGGTPDPFYPTVRALIGKAHHIDIVTAFVQDSGLRILQPQIFDALMRGAHIRILGGDYLHITQGRALQRLLDWSVQAQVHNWSGTIQVRVHESKGLSFHPKCWHFQTKKEDLAYVGSSNLSFTALCKGIEWNLALRKSQQPLVYNRITHSINHLFQQATTLTQDWIDRYMEEAEQAPLAPLPLGEVEWEEEEYTPLPIQLEALEALKKSRNDGRTRALLIMATGLGKTYVSIFDTLAVQPKRILFLAHRKEIISQAASSFRRLYPRSSFGWFIGDKQDTHGDITFASVQKLSRHRTQFTADHFDYIIIDEVHHATATTYRSIIDYFQPDFLLGLTATPDRSDQHDVRALFDDHCAFQVGLGFGISKKLLTPFHYIGRLDPIDYKKIPWKRNHFEEEPLNQQLCTEERMKILHSLWTEHPATRTLVFCSSIVHADSVGAYLNQQGINTAVLHSQSHSDPRAENIDALNKGDIECICVVDLFNEGIDIPALDRIIMLRPTSSGILFLQQLGRGLRLHPNKEKLLVVDLVGNHHVFLQRLHALSSISTKGGLRTLLSKKSSILPEGCLLDIEVGVIELLSSLMSTHKNPAQKLFGDLCSVYGSRPELSTFHKLGGRTQQLYRDEWFSFLKRQNKLTHSEQILVQKHGEWLRMLEHTAMTKSYKMVSLSVLIGAQALQTGMELESFLMSVRSYLMRDPLLRHDAPNEVSDINRWKRYFLRWLSTSWSKGKNWLIIDKGLVRTPITVHNALIASFFDMSMELIRYRLLLYRTRIQAKPLRFIAEWKQDKQGGYLLLPSAAELLPSGTDIVRDHQNNLWKINWKHPKTRIISPFETSQSTKKGFSGNVHSSLLRFFFLSDGWHMEPIGAYVSPFIERMESTVIETWPHQKNTVWLPQRIPSSPLHFVLRSPKNIDGLTPIKKGDWLLLRWRNSAPQTAKLVQDRHGISLLSATEPTEENIIAALDTHFSPSELAPKTGVRFSIDRFALLFGLSEAPQKELSRIDGHLFLCISKKSSCPTPTSYSSAFQAYPYEVAHVVYIDERKGTYLGIATQSQNGWRIPPLSSWMWKKMPPPQHLITLPITKARSLFDALPTKGWFVHNHLHAKIHAKTKNTYTLSFHNQKSRINVNDIAWALQAKSVVNKPTPLDLTHVRYLMGHQTTVHQRRVLLASWLCTYGAHFLKNKSQKRNPVDVIRNSFPTQTAHKSLLEEAVLLRVPKKKILVIVFSNAISTYKDLWKSQYKETRTRGWHIHILLEKEIYDTKICIINLKNIVG